MCDEEDLDDLDLEELQARVDRIACEVLGHRPSAPQTYTSRRGQRWDWISCMRCGAALRGKQPPSTTVFGEILMETYEAAFRANQEMVSPLVELFGNVKR